MPSAEVNWDFPDSYEDIQNRRRLMLSDKPTFDIKYRRGTRLNGLEKRRR